MANQKGSGLLMVWADVPADKEPDFNRSYNEEHLAERLAIPGFLSGARYEAVKGGPKHLAVYELESAAWNAQRDAVPVSTTMRNHMKHATGSPGVYVKTFELPGRK